MISSTNLNAVVQTIVEHQINVIGPLALEQANKVEGIKITGGRDMSVTVSSKDSNKVLIELVGNYEKLFGRASVEVCRDAVKEINPPLSKEELPQILQ